MKENTIANVNLLPQTAKNIIYLIFTKLYKLRMDFKKRERIKRC